MENESEGWGWRMRARDGVVENESDGWGQVEMDGGDGRETGSVMEGEENKSQGLAAVPTSCQPHPGLEGQRR